MPLYTEKRTEAIVLEKTAFALGKNLCQCELAVVSFANYKAECIWKKCTLVTSVHFWHFMLVNCLAHSSYLYLGEYPQMY